MHANVAYMEGMGSTSSLLLQLDKYDSKIPPPQKREGWFDQPLHWSWLQYSHWQLQYGWANLPIFLNQTKPTSFLQWRKGRNEYHLNHQIWGSIPDIWPMIQNPFPCSALQHLPETSRKHGGCRGWHHQQYKQFVYDSSSSGHLIHQLSGFIQVDILSSKDSKVRSSPVPVLPSLGSLHQGPDFWDISTFFQVTLVASKSCHGHTWHPGTQQ